MSRVGLKVREYKKNLQGQEEHEMISAWNGIHRGSWEGNRILFCAALLNNQGWCSLGAQM